MIMELVQRNSEREFALKVKARATMFGEWSEVAEVRRDNESRWFKSLATETFQNLGHDEIVARCVLEITTTIGIEGGATVDFIPMTITAIEGQVGMLFLTKVRSVINPEIKCQALVTITVRGSLKALRCGDAE